MQSIQEDTLRYFKKYKVCEDSPLCNVDQYIKVESSATIISKKSHFVKEGMFCSWFIDIGY